MQTYQQDCIALAERRVRRGEISGRALYQALAGPGLAAPALAQERQPGMVNWGALAPRLLACLRAKPEPRVGLLGRLGNGPTDPKTAAMVPAALRPFNPTDPERARRQVVRDGNWWSDNNPPANQGSLDMVTG